MSCKHCGCSCADSAAVGEAWQAMVTALRAIDDCDPPGSDSFANWLSSTVATALAKLAAVDARRAGKDGAK